jgi:hypothetical protein
LSLVIDGQEVYQGKHCFQGIGTWDKRGYVAVDDREVDIQLSAGEHEIEAFLETTEPFGWGIILQTDKDLSWK